MAFHLTQPDTTFRSCVLHCFHKSLAEDDNWKETVIIDADPAVNICMHCLDFPRSIKLAIKQRIYGDRICRMYIGHCKITKQIPNELIKLIVVFYGSTDMNIISVGDDNFDFKYLQMKQRNILEMSRNELIQHAHNLEILLKEEERITKGLKCAKQIIINFLKEDGREALIQFFKLRNRCI